MVEISEGSDVIVEGGSDSIVEGGSYSIVEIRDVKVSDVIVMVTVPNQYT